MSSWTALAEHSAGPFSTRPLPPGQRIALRIEYDGSRYCGWQAQPHLPHIATVQATLEAAYRRRYRWARQLRDTEHSSRVYAKLDEAWRTLKDPKQRSAYDEERRQASPVEQADPADPSFYLPPPPPKMEELFHDHDDDTHSFRPFTVFGHSTSISAQTALVAFTRPSHESMPFGAVRVARSAGKSQSG